MIVHQKAVQIGHMRHLKFAICLLLTYCGSATVSAQTTIGYVLEVSGDWVLNNSNKLSQGERLPAGGSIRRTSSPKTSRIAIADLRGELITSRNCAVDNCSAAILLPRQAKPTSTWNAVFDTAMELIWGAPDKYSAHRSRSGELSDGVLKIVDGKVDFSPLLRGEGEQYIRWQDVSTASVAALGSRPILLPKSATISAPELKPGLYAFDLVRRMGDNFETVSSARILLADQAKYDAAHASYRRAVELTEKWGANVRPETSRLYLQTTLVDLARESTR